MYEVCLVMFVCKESCRCVQFFRINQGAAIAQSVYYVFYGMDNRGIEIRLPGSNRFTRFSLQQGKTATFLQSTATAAAILLQGPYDEHNELRVPGVTSSSP
jgi:hypothetical protein